MSDSTIQEIYQILFNEFGPQHWWPGDSVFEIIVGAILTQNTNWSNVELALDNLKKHQMLDPLKLNDLSHQRLAKFIQPSGYFNVKAQRLKNFIDYIVSRYQCDWDEFAAQPLDQLRDELLSVNGIGPEYFMLLKSRRL